MAAGESIYCQLPQIGPENS